MGTESTRPRPDDLLDGWKAIADHLGRTERTVQRWEKSKGLPVRYLQAVSPDELPRVFAYKSELDVWWNEQQTKQSDKTEKEAIEIGLGDRDEAFHLLDEGYDERSDYLVYLRSDLWVDPLRKDPRFPALLKKLGLPE